MSFYFRTLAALVLGAVLLGSYPAAVYAQEQEEEESSGSTFMSQQTYNRISRSHTAIEEGKYQEALDDLLDLANDVADRPYELAITLQSIGYVYISQEKWELAAQYFQRALKQNALPAEPEKQLIYTLAQIFATLGEYQKTIDLLTDWFKTAKNPPADAYIMMANAYAAQDKYREAYPHVKTALEKAEKPREDWYKLALGVQFELKKYAEAATTLEALVAHWPDKEMYWKQLSGIYMELGQEQKALATLSAAYQRGLVTRSEDILNLARLFMLNEVPYQAGRVLEPALEKEQVEKTQKNYELLSQAWVQAREYEKGIEALVNAAALADDGALFVRAAQLEMSLANWEGAQAAAQKAIEKGGLDSKKTGQAYLLLGTSAAEQKDFDAAINAFSKARGYPETRQTASQWLSFVQTEQQVTSLN